MQLLLRRRILQGTTTKFALWAKFEVTEEEKELLYRHHTLGGYITIEASRRDLWRAAVISFFIALVAGSLLSAMTSTMSATVQTPRGMVQQPLTIPWFVWGLLFVFVFSTATYLIYEQLRLAIRIQDMLGGREFKNKSLVLMARRERRLIGYAHAFAQFLEKLKEWEGTEIIEIGEDDHDRALRLVTDTYAPA